MAPLGSKSQISGFLLCEWGVSRFLNNFDLENVGPAPRRSQLPEGRGQRKKARARIGGAGAPGPGAPDAGDGGAARPLRGDLGAPGRAGGLDFPSPEIFTEALRFQACNMTNTHLSEGAA